MTNESEDLAQVFHPSTGHCYKSCYGVKHNLKALIFSLEGHKVNTTSSCSSSHKEGPILAIHLLSVAQPTQRSFWGPASAENNCPNSQVATMSNPSIGASLPHVNQIVDLGRVKIQSVGKSHTFSQYVFVWSLARTTIDR